jgi:nucleotide-binding universal stress UspA family protein
MSASSQPPREPRAHVLLATDLSPASRPHVQFAIRLADRLGARTTLFHAAIARAATVEPMLAVVPVAPLEDLAATRQHLQALAASCATARPVHVAVDAAADARTAILAAAARVAADLLILPTHGRTGLRRALLGSTAEQVLRQADRPVLLVTDRMLAAGADAAREDRPVVLATDLSPTAQGAHGPAADLARRLGLPLLVLGVLPAREPPPMGGGAPVKPVPTEPQQRLRECAQRLREVATALGDGLHVEVQAQLADAPAAAIADVAQAQGAAFVVVGTHARRGIRRALQGSIAEDLVRHATVPVLCVPVRES